MKVRCPPKAFVLKPVVESPSPLISLVAKKSSVHCARKLSVRTSCSKSIPCPTLIRTVIVVLVGSASAAAAASEATPSNPRMRSYGRSF